MKQMRVEKTFFQSKNFYIYVLSKIVLEVRDFYCKAQVLAVIN